MIQCPAKICFGRGLVFFWRFCNAEFADFIEKIPGREWGSKGERYSCSGPEASDLLKASPLKTCSLELTLRTLNESPTTLCIISEGLDQPSCLASENQTGSAVLIYYSIYMMILAQATGNGYCTVYRRSYRSFALLGRPHTLNRLHKK